jgi:hypothetical protein
MVDGPPFAWAAGSVVGSDHRRAGRNCQDAVRILADADALVAVVADGCGSAPHSEVGAHLLAQLLAVHLLAAAPAVSIGGAAAAARALADAVSALDGLADALAGARPDGRRRAVHDHLLATAVAAVVTRERTVVLCAGDGVWGINGELRVVSAAGNAPPYPAYRLLGGAFGAADVVVWDGPTAAVDTLLLATDGAAELLGREAACVPGTEEPVLPPDRWHEAAAFFRNPHALGRYLVRLARDDQAIDWEAGAARRTPGLLRDDTTVVLLRRTAAAARER